MTRVAVRVQHHPSRAHLLPELHAALEGLDDVAAIADPNADGPPDTWATHRACLEATPAAASHLLVLQDDALPCQHFASSLLERIEKKPDDLLCLFAPGFGFIRRRMLEAARAHEPFALLPQTAFVPLVAVVYPDALVERLLAWSSGEGWPAASARTLRGADDGVVAQFCRSSRVHVWATVPCLADHRVDVPSLARPAHHAGAHRRAAML